MQMAGFPPTPMLDMMTKPPNVQKLHCLQLGRFGKFARMQDTHMIDSKHTGIPVRMKTFCSRVPTQWFRRQRQILFGEQTTTPSLHKWYSPLMCHEFQSQAIPRQEVTLVVAKPNPQPRSRYRQSKSPGPSRPRRSKSPPIEQVAAAQKVRLVAQEDPRKEEEEFALMKKHVSSLISDYRFLTDKHQVAWQSEVMKEIQAQLNDFKMRAENAEQVARQAEGRAAEAEKHMRVEKEGAAIMIAEAYPRSRDPMSGCIRRIIVHWETQYRRSRRVSGGPIQAS